MSPKKRTLKRTFAAELRHFVEAIDIVDDQTFRDVRDLVWKYLTDQLEAEYFEIMSPTIVGRQAQLKVHWSSRDDDLAWSIRDEDGRYTNAVTAAFDNNAPLWLASPDGSVLAEASTVVDQWSRLEDLPPYKPVIPRPIRTAVVVPLPSTPPRLVFFLETKQPVGITEVAKEELLILAESLGFAMELNRANRTQSRLTREALRELGGILDAAEFPKLAKPRVFFAFSDRADRVVIEVVKTVLREFQAQLDVHDWDEMRESGNIPTQITHSIARSRFGVCYLSEPQKNGDGGGARAYIDNPNVVFESGMLQAQTNDYADEDEPAGWIPIRERNSPQAPFDFASERMLMVPRVPGTGGVDRQRLAEELRQRVKWLLREP
jgi:hypothetical protein